MLPAPASAGTQLRLETVLGDVSVELFDTLRPVSVNNFLNYVDDDDYTDSIVHRSVPGFVIQGGGFFLDGVVLLSIPTDPPFQDIPGPSNLRGTLAMAENALGATSQWFINLSDNIGLDPDFTVFGEVTFGMDVVDAIAAPLYPYSTSSASPPRSRRFFSAKSCNTASTSCAITSRGASYAAASCETISSTSLDPSHKSRISLLVSSSTITRSGAWSTQLSRASSNCCRT